MTFLYIISVIVFIALTAFGVLVLTFEVFKTREQRRLEKLHAWVNGHHVTYWNSKVLVVIVLWIASGAVTFW